MVLFDKHRIWIIIPAFNESGRVGKVVNAVRQLGYNNILVVDDGSLDNTGIEAKNLGATVVKHVLNRGAGAATQTGLMYVREKTDFEAVVTLDGDTQHEPRDLDHLISAHFEQNADMTIGNRFINKENNIPIWPRVFNGFANIITTILCMRKVTDSQSGLKVMSPKLLKKVTIENDGYEFCSELLIKAHHEKLNIINVSAKVYYTTELQNKGQNPMNGLRTFSSLIQSVLFKK